VALVAGLIVLPALTAAAAAQQFFAEQDADGEIGVVDDAGAAVPVVNGDPVGTRPYLCPSDAYYFTELDTDKAQLVLTDCATGQGSYAVTILGPVD
jgi:hypothetical protein